MPVFTKAWGLGSIDLSYWAEQMHLFCLGTFEQFIFIGQATQGQGQGTIWQACCEWKGEVLCVFACSGFYFPTSMLGMSVAFPGVFLCILHVCKIPSGYVSKFVKSKREKINVI